MQNKKEICVKTHLTDDQSRAMDVVIAAKGLTQAGYLRNLIIKDIVNSQQLLSDVNDIFDRAKIGHEKEKF